MDENALQIELAKRWMKDGLTIGGQRLFLLGWELMPETWHMNENDNEWWHKSIDFVFIDQHQHLWAMEVKKQVRLPRDCWSLLCQVTDRACDLFDKYQPDKQDEFYFACGRDAERCCPIRNTPLSIALDRFFGFGKDVPRLQAPQPIHRIVAAPSFHEDFPCILDRFNSMSCSDLKSFLWREYTIKHEFEKVVKRDDWSSKVVAPVLHIQLANG